MNSKTTLHILLVLSMIGSGLSFLSQGLSTLLLPHFQATYNDNPALFPEEMHVMLEQYLSIPRPYFLASTIVYALSLAGIILMWKPRASGFHCYTIAQLLLLVLPFLFLDRSQVSIGNIMMTLLFVAVYYILLRSLGAFSKEQQPPTESQNMDENT